MINISDETFPDDSIINTPTPQPPPPQPQPPPLFNLPPPLINLPAPKVLSRQTSTSRLDVDAFASTEIASLSPFDSHQSHDKARSLSPECLRSPFIGVSPPKNDATTTPVVVGGGGAPKISGAFQRLAAPASGSTVSLNSEGFVKGGGTSRRLGAAFKKQPHSLLSKKSASVDSLNYDRKTRDSSGSIDQHGATPPQSATTTAGRRRTMRYDHVQSKVKASIDELRESDRLQRQQRLQRHRSMPEALCGGEQMPPAKPPRTSAPTSDSRGDSAPVADVRLQQMQELLAEKEQHLAACYAASQRENDERMRLVSKMDAMRLELQRTRDEREQRERDHQQQVGKLQLQLQQQHLLQHLQVPTASSSTSTGASTSGASSSTAYPPSSSVASSDGHRRRSTANLTGHDDVDDASFGLSVASSPAAGSLHTVNLGLHHRQSFGRKSPPHSGQEGAGGRARSVSSGIGNTTGDSLTSDAAATTTQALFVDHNRSAQSSGACPIITSSSMSSDLQEFDADADADANAQHQHDIVLHLPPRRNHWSGVGAQPDGGHEQAPPTHRRRRLARSLRKRLARMLGRCAPCLKGLSSSKSSASSSSSHRRRDRAGADDCYDEDISMLYVGLDEEINSGDEGSAVTATTGYNSF